MSTRRERRLAEIRKVSRECANDINITYPVQKYRHELKGYQYVKKIARLSPSNYIKYIDLDCRNIKFGILTKITQDEYGNKVLHLKRSYKGHPFYWKIYPHKYHIFTRPFNPRKKPVFIKLSEKYLENKEKKIDVIKVKS